MGSVSLTGSDSVLIDSRVMTDFADGDIVNLDFSNDIAAVKTGKNGNSIYAFNASGETCTCTLRIGRGTADDKYLNSRYYEYKNDPPAFSLISGMFTKRLGDGHGNITNEIYNMSGGIIQKLPPAKSNVEGDTGQAVAEWSILFTNSQRSM